ncbi:MAG: hypothetical protein HOM14_01730 [Gammaproteobacteria bacterium]|jgi:hypothetical protein|nr:hypothetical protein [Gammaproteobacteria bacterium]MBT3721857.1 hypothetical protein [Gammaproteobacteria bacterium]MBT4077869.1 hypothetical protein [Gammaproteobacteria bacterium]MBT4194959.1 hypothetical protein [Gammaproteobacteria bacterium]MBT4448462.1 hypothetical protein [Gammaproteobacteria bacterium]
MIKTTLYTTALLAAYSLTITAFAQNNQNMHEQMQQHHNMSMQHQGIQAPAFKPAPMPKRPPFTEFPTPDELARMTPPEPMTEDKIKARFAKRKAQVEKTVAHDRKHAEKYAKDFARFQKHQADQLAKIMARAEKQREAMLNRIDKREQRVLENFRKRNAANNTK